MGLTVFHKPTAPPALSASILYDRPMVAVCYARGGVNQVDALVFNASAAGLLGELGVGDPPAEVELYHDPSTNEVGVKPWSPDCPESTLHHVHPTRFVGAGVADWTNRMRTAWPLKVEAPQFMGTWHLPEVALYRPAPARLGPGMLIFNPRRVVTP